MPLACAHADVIRRSKSERTLVLIAEIHAQPLAALEHSPLYEELGEGQIYMTLEDALDRSREYLATRQPTPCHFVPRSQEVVESGPESTPTLRARETCGTSPRPADTRDPRRVPKRQRGPHADDRQESNDQRSEQERTKTRGERRERMIDSVDIAKTLAHEGASARIAEHRNDERNREAE
jgi:hypothetical protein